MSLPKRQRLGQLSVSALALAIAVNLHSAYAQNNLALPAPPPPPASAQSFMLKPVIITARHRAERAQSVPISLTSINAAQIATVGSSNLNKLQQLVPSLTVDAFNPRNTSLNIRGLGAVPNLANDGLEGGVGVYVDGVLLARPAQSVFDLPDLLAIELLRGPQGTLFGKNTVSGAINITTRLPSFTPEADGSISYGTQNYVQLKASASSTLFGSDKFAFRLSVQGTQHNGYISNLDSSERYGNQDDKGVRLQLLGEVTPNLTVRAIFDYSHQKANCCVNLPVGFAPLLPGGTSFTSRAAIVGYTLPAPDVFGRKTDVDSPVYYDMETGGSSLQADYNLSGFTITSISAIRYWNWYPHNDVDGTALPIFTKGNGTDFQRQVSQELRLTSPLGPVVDYTAGLYYFYQSIGTQNLVSYGPAAGSFLAGASPASPVGQLYDTALDGFSAVSNSIYYTNSFAAYGQATWHVLPQFDLTTGLRYTYEDKSATYNAFQQGGAASASAGVAALRTAFAPIIAYGVSTYNALPAGLVTLSYKPVANIMAYSTYSHGAKSAGINLISTTIAPKIVSPESIDNYEVGIKTTLFGGLLLLDGDLFWDEDKDYQATLLGFLPGGRTYTYVAGIPKVRSRGFEIDSQAQVTSNLYLFFSGIYDNAYNEKDPSGPCPYELGGGTKSCNLTGKQVAGVSPWTGSFGGEYDRNLPQIKGHSAIAYFSGNVILKNGFYSGADDSEYSFVPGYGVGNVIFGLKGGNNAWNLSGWVRNVTNAHYYIARSVTGSFPAYNLITGQVGDPISGGVTLAGKF